MKRVRVGLGLVFLSSSAACVVDREIGASEMETEGQASDNPDEMPSDSDTLEWTQTVSDLTVLDVAVNDLGAVLLAGRAAVAGPMRLRAVDPATGEPLWTVDLAGPPQRNEFVRLGVIGEDSVAVWTTDDGRLGAARHRPDGSEVWSNTIVEEDVHWVSDLSVAPDGRLAAVGRLWPDAVGDTRDPPRGFALTWAPDGTPGRWFLATEPDSECSSATWTADGQLAVAVGTNDPVEGDATRVLWYDPLDGTLMQSLDLPREGDPVFVRGMASSGQGLMLAGYHLVEAGPEYTWIGRIEAGALVWSRSTLIEDPTWNIGLDMATVDGGVIIAGDRSVSVDGTGLTGWLARVDDDGSIQWRVFDTPGVSVATDGARVFSAQGNVVESLAL